MKIKCPRCGNMVESGAAAPGASVSCTSCGNVLTVPKKSKVWLIILLACAAACIPCTGILAAIAVPNFIRFQSRAKQTEARANLRSFYASARLASMDGDTPPTDLAQIQFQPERGNRYAYFTAFEGPMEERTSEGLTPPEEKYGVLVDTFKFPGAGVSPQQAQRVAAGVTPGLTGECPGDTCGVTMVAVGNIDGDETLDVWSISTAPRTGPNGAPIEAGEAFHHVDDLRE